MAIHLVEIVTRLGKVVGANFIEGERGASMPVGQLQEFLSSTKVENMAIVDGKIVGTQGNLKRYSKYPITVLEKSKDADKEYKLYVKGKGIIKCSEADAFNMIKKHGATNAKAVDREGKGIVSALEGTFEEGSLSKKVNGAKTKTEAEVLADIKSISDGAEEVIHLIDDKYFVIKGKKYFECGFVDVSKKKYVEYIKYSFEMELELVYKHKFPDFLILVVKIQSDRNPGMSVIRISNNGRKKVLASVMAPGLSSGQKTVYKIHTVAEKNGDMILGLHAEAEEYISTMALIVGNVYHESMSASRRKLYFKEYVRSGSKKCNILTEYSIKECGADGLTRTYRLGRKYRIQEENDYRVVKPEPLDRESMKEFGLVDLDKFNSTREFGKDILIEDGENTTMTQYVASI